MKVSVTTLPLTDLDVDLLLLPIAKDDVETLLSSLGGSMGEVLHRAADDFTGDPKDAVLFYPDSARARRVALLGMGSSPTINAERLREVGACGAELAAQRKAATVALRVPKTVLDAETAGQAFVEGFALASYRFLRYKTGQDEAYAGPERLVLHAAEDEKAVRYGADRGRVVAEATNTARNLFNS